MERRHFKVVFAATAIGISVALFGSCRANDLPELSTPKTGDNHTRLGINPDTQEIEPMISIDDHVGVNPQSGDLVVRP